MDNKTIYALSTLFGKSGIAVFRISGASAFSVFGKMTSIDMDKYEDRKMYFAELRHPVSRETLDSVLIVGFKAPHSFTGDDTVEINCHGSKAVIRSILEALSVLPDFRLAEAGEFSRRAFYNGKMDLTEADGLADLIDAETKLQQKIALQQMGGSLLNLYDNWRSQLVEILSYIEAFIDFPEENIPQNTVFKIEKKVKDIQLSIQKHLSDNKVEEHLRDGFRVVIAGPANAGKSSLINAIVNRNVAIVSDIAGTTRDVIDAYIDIKGVPVILSDTAGLPEGNDKIEQIGIDMAKEKINEADFKIFIFDASNNNTTPDIFNMYMTAENNYILVANKADKLSAKQKENLVKQNYVLISAKQNDNIQAITDKLYYYFSEIFADNSSQIITRRRYKDALIECLDNLKRFNLNKDVELAAEDIRLACRSIGKITGRVEVDEILDKIFSSFCIGK